MSKGKTSIWVGNKKRCNRCEKFKPIESFYLRKGRLNGLGRQSGCKECEKEFKRPHRLAHYLRNKDAIRAKQKEYYRADTDKYRDRDLKYRYSFSLKEKKLLTQKQNNRCAICLSIFKKREPHIDHDHVTGKIRGLLCSLCNVGLGYFKENTDTMKKAIKYLRAHKRKRGERVSQNQKVSDSDM